MFWDVSSHEGLPCRLPDSAPWDVGLRDMSWQLWACLVAECFGRETVCVHVHVSVSRQHQQTAATPHNWTGAKGWPLGSHLEICGHARRPTSCAQKKLSMTRPATRIPIYTVPLQTAVDAILLLCIWGQGILQGRQCFCSGFIHTWIMHSWAWCECTHRYRLTLLCN